MEGPAIMVSVAAMVVRNGGRRGMVMTEAATGERELLVLWRPAHLLALRLAASHELAEDAVQDACLKALTALRRGDRPADLRVWFLRIVANAVRDQLRGEGRRRKREAAVAQEHQAPPMSPGVEIREALAAAMRQLDADEQTALSLHYESGLTQAEAAAVLEIPEGTVRTRVARGLKRLRELLGLAGLTAAPAAIVAAFVQGPLEPGPASLAAAVEKLVSGGPMAEGTGAAKASSAAKGGVAMKVILGVVVAGVLAGSVAMLSPGGAGDSPRAAAPAPAAAGLTYEHYAFTSFLADSLDGPRREALGSGIGPLDADFNCYQGGRVIRGEDGMVQTIAGGLPEFGNDEGPAAFLPRLSPIRGTGFGQGIGGWLVVGTPLKGGDNGCLYAYSDTRIMKVWKNADKGGRWWAKIIAGPGKVEVPGARILWGQAWRKPGEKEDKPVFYTNSGFYILESGSGGAKFVCILDVKGLKDRLPKDKGGRTPYPSEGWVDSGGNYYLCYYFGAGFRGATATIWRVSPDGAKVEPYITNADGAKTGQDGPGMNSGWFCGPHACGVKTVSLWYPPGVICCGAHDEFTLRRIVGGRVSTLYEDGEWREASQVDFKNQVANTSSLAYGANGWALTCTSNEGFSHAGKGRGEGTYLIKGIDFSKPTVGK
jgi:RNA polymerase sigma-70 factor (ECF subfamily)